MAINRRALEKIEEACQDDKNMCDFLRNLLIYEVNEPSQYTAEYERLVKEHAKGVEKHAL